MVRLREEKDVEILRQAALILEAENRRLTAELLEVTRELMIAKGRDPAALQLRLKGIEQQLAKVRAKLFGESSERKEKASVDANGERAKEKKGHGPRVQPALPTVDVVHTLDDADRVCTACGGDLAVWDGQSEDAEEVDVVERHFVVKTHRRQKYRCGLSLPRFGGECESSHQLVSCSL